MLTAVVGQVKNLQRAPLKIGRSRAKEWTRVNRYPLIFILFALTAAVVSAYGLFAAQSNSASTAIQLANLRVSNLRLLAQGSSIARQNQGLKSQLASLKVQNELLSSASIRDLETSPKAVLYIVGSRPLQIGEYAGREADAEHTAPEWERFGNIGFLPREVRALLFPFTEKLGHSELRIFEGRIFLPAGGWRTTLGVRPSGFVTPQAIKPAVHPDRIEVIATDNANAFGLVVHHEGVVKSLSLVNAMRASYREREPVLSFECPIAPEVSYGSLVETWRRNIRTITLGYYLDADEQFVVRMPLMVEFRAEQDAVIADWYLATEPTIDATGRIMH